MINRIRSVELDKTDTNTVINGVIKSATIELAQQINEESQNASVNMPMIKEIVDKSVVFLGEDAYIKREYPAKYIKDLQSND